jgi:hypothetical protein
MFSTSTPAEKENVRSKPIIPENSIYTQVRFKLWKMTEKGAWVPELRPTLDGNFHIEIAGSALLRLLSRRTSKIKRRCLVNDIYY